MSKLIVINLFAGPGVGKSVMAAELFAVMKKAGSNVEMASEYAKDMVYEQRSNILSDQLYVLAKQNRRLQRLEDQVDFVISDSPLLLCPIYATREYYPTNFKDFALEVFHGYDNINLFLERPAHREYNAGGRTQKNLGAAQVVDKKIHQFLVNNDIPFRTIVPDLVKVDFQFVRDYVLDPATHPNHPLAIK